MRKCRSYCDLAFYKFNRIVPMSRFSRDCFRVMMKGPVVVPVFGRGRALEVIPAADLTGSLIEDLTLYLSGPCSCQVKERNPGFDLLMATDWERE